MVNPRAAQRRQFSTLAGVGIALIALAVVHKLGKMIGGERTVNLAIDLGKDPQAFTLPQAPSGTGRLAAAAYFNNEQDFPKGTCGYVIGKGIAAFAKVCAELTGNPEFGGGKIGEHFMSPAMKDALQQPATDENLHSITRGETDWWRSQRGLPFIMGGGVTAQERFKVLEAIRDGIPGATPPSGLDELD